MLFYTTSRAVAMRFSFFGFIMSSSTTRLSPQQIPRLTSDNFRCCHRETEQGDCDFCLNQSHRTDTDPTSREWMLVERIHNLLTSSHEHQLSYSGPNSHSVQSCSEKKQQQKYQIKSSITNLDETLGEENLNCFFQQRKQP